MPRFRRRDTGFNQNVGKPGVIYILVNDGLNPEFIKIGCSTRSGHARANDLNADANTGTPGLFRSVFEHRTVDCGLAEKKVFAELHAHRKGKWGQEFFALNADHAKPVITQVCISVDQEARQIRERLEVARTAQLQAQTPSPAPLRQMVTISLPPDMAIGPVSPVRLVPAPVQPKNNGWPLWFWIFLMVGGLLFATMIVDTKPKSVMSRSSPPVSQTANVKLTGPTEAAPLTPVQTANTTKPSTSVDSPAPDRETEKIDPTPNGSLGDQPQKMEGDAVEKLGPHEPSPTPAVSHSPPTMASIGREERASINAVCATDKYRNGPAAYNNCLSGQLARLEKANQTKTDLAGLSRDELASLRAVCSSDKYYNGPVAYNSCVAKQVQQLRESSAKMPNLAVLSRDERSSIQSVCSTAKYSRGPAAYNQCLTTHLTQLDQSEARHLDLSALTREERSSIAAVCSTDKYRNGPVAYNRCVKKHLDSLK